MVLLTGDERKRRHIYRFFMNAKHRANKKGVPFEITQKHLEDIATDKCPVFGVTFDWGLSGFGKGNSKGDNAPSLDRVISELGYIDKNVVFISHLANKIKQDATEKELYAVADWLHDKRKEVLNALQITDAQIPKTNGRAVKKNAAHGAVHGAGAGKDCDGAHHYQGELFGKDTGYCT